MALTIYRRHSKLSPFFPPATERVQQPSLQTRVLDPGRGSIAGHYMRRALDLTDSDVAAAVVHQWESAAARGALPLTTSNILQAVASTIQREDQSSPSAKSGPSDRTPCSFAHTRA